MPSRDADTHSPLASLPAAEHAIEAYLAAVAAVDPTVLVRQHVRTGALDDWFGSRERPKPIHVLALGKAAARMVWGLVEASVPFSGLGVAPRGVQVPLVDTMRWLPGDHPVPGDASFAAGQAVQEWLASLPQDAPLLVLLSGGASSCVEAPAPGAARADVVALARRLLREGHAIERVNRERAAASALKAGKLGRLALQRTPRIRVWLLADTPPEVAAAVVGSGPFWQGEAPTRIPHTVLADNGHAVVAAGMRLGLLGLTVYRHAPRLDGDVASECAAFLQAFRQLPPGSGVALVGGGEPTVALPAEAPPGGRAQHAALAMAGLLAQAGMPDAVFLAAGTDGVDGTGSAAGAWTTAADWDQDAAAALARFDAHGLLERRGRTIPADPTGTNVNDVWVLLRP